MDEEIMTGAAMADGTGDDWDNIDWSDVETEDDEGELADEQEADGDGENQPDTKEESEKAESEKDSKAADSEAESGENSDTKAEPVGSDGGFEVVHLGKTVKVSREEAPALLQMGLDYNRVKDSLNQIKNSKTDFEDFVHQLAESQGLDAESMMDSTRARLLIAKETAEGKELSEADALRRVIAERLSRKEKAPEPESADPEPETTGEDGESKAEEEKQKSFRRFAEKFPEVKASDIPKEVWDKYRDGADLAGIYATWENKQLREKIKTLEENEKNKQRSTGSRQSAGAKKDKTAFDALWDEDD